MTDGGASTHKAFKEEKMIAKPSIRFSGDAKLVSSTRGAMIFGTGHSTPAFQRNYQNVEWELSDGAKIKLEVFAFQLDGRNINDTPSGPRMPLLRTAQVNHKKMFRSVKVWGTDEFKAAFEVLNCAIRTTEIGKWGLAEGGVSPLVQRKAYEHEHFGPMEYYDVTDDLPLEALTEFVLTANSPDALLKKFTALYDSPDSVALLEAVAKKKANELEGYRARYS